VDFGAIIKYYVRMKKGIFGPLPMPKNGGILAYLSKFSAPLSF
jgi:hypothetical protein